MSLMSILGIGSLLKQVTSSGNSLNSSNLSSLISNLVSNKGKDYKTSKIFNGGSNYGT